MKTDATAKTTTNTNETQAKGEALTVRSGLRAGFRLSGWGDVGLKPKSFQQDDLATQA